MRHASPRMLARSVSIVTAEVDGALRKHRWYMRCVLRHRCRVYSLDWTPSDQAKYFLSLEHVLLVPNNAAPVQQ